MKNFRSSASSSRRPANIVVAFGEKPPQKPNSLSPRLSRNGLSSACAKTGAQTQKVRARAGINRGQSFIWFPSFWFYLPQRRKGAKPPVSLRLTLRLCGKVFKSLDTHECNQRSSSKTLQVL